LRGDRGRVAHLHRLDFADFGAGDVDHAHAFAHLAHEREVFPEVLDHVDLRISGESV
jgi:hypothetical protein